MSSCGIDANAVCELGWVLVDLGTTQQFMYRIDNCNGAIPEYFYNSSFQVLNCYTLTYLHPDLFDWTGALWMSGSPSKIVVDDTEPVYDS